jgi:predicted DNA-binding ribbon-helix-helix protein
MKKGHAYLYTYVRETQRDKLKTLAERRDMTVSALMRDILEQYLRQHKLKDVKPLIATLEL